MEPSTCIVNYGTSAPAFSNSTLRALGCSIVCLCIAFAISKPLPANAADPTFESALYYDKNNKLLQIEDLSGVDLTQRLTQEISEFPIPRITESNHGVTPACPAAGYAQSMSLKATYAIYYGENDPDNPNEVSRPLKLEYLSGVGARTIHCLPVNVEQACTLPLHCAMGCVGCPSYCCIK